MIQWFLNLGFLGVVYLGFSLVSGIALPVIVILGISAGLDGRYFTLTGYLVAFFSIFYLFELLWGRLKTIWKQGGNLH